jgi:putative endonuclease
MRISAARLGKLGEWWALWLYRLRGYRVVGRNVRVGGGEIDLVVRRGSTLVVAEVKTRQSRAAGDGYEAVGWRKQQQLVRLGAMLLARERRPVQLRFDVVSLYWNGWRFVANVIPDAFSAGSTSPDARTPASAWRWAR